jgi:Leucine-rich repeat (LRR) protein
MFHSSVFLSYTLRIISVFIQHDFLIIGELVSLRELNLTNNSIRNLPYELGKLFRLQSLGKHQIIFIKIFKIIFFYFRINGKSITC